MSDLFELGFLESTDLLFNHHSAILSDFGLERFPSLSESFQVVAEPSVLIPPSFSAPLTSMVRRRREASGDFDWNAERRFLVFTGE